MHLANKSLGPHHPPHHSCSRPCQVLSARGLFGSTAKARRRRLNVSASSEEAFRNKVKHLTRLFYADESVQKQGSSRQQRSSRTLQGLHFQNLPLWRVEWAVLPGMQEILHVLAPHYVHMFERIFAQPRPWVFGHLYLPGGSKNLGSATHSLASGSKSPLVGVLMQVTRAVRLRDGKFLLLATALGRFKVVRCVRELPYTEADVELLEDCEHMEGLSQIATAAVMQSASNSTSVSALMAASTAAAREAAAALHWSWLKGYEIKVATRQEWPGPGPREGENDHETYFLVQELAEQGVADVLPLPDGVVIGRCNLQEVAADAEAAMQQALQDAAARLIGGSSSSSGQQPGVEGSTLQTPAAGPDQTGSEGSSSSSSSSSGPLSSSDEPPSIVSLNTAAERGVTLQGPEVCELTASSTTCGTLEEVIMLEAAVWQQLDILAALSSRVKGRRHSLPFGLLQLRPPPPQLSVAAATALANRATQAGTDQQQDIAAASTRTQQAASSSSTHPPPAEVVSDTDEDDDTPSSSSNSSSPEDAQNASAAGSSSGVSSSLSSRVAADPQQQWSSTALYAFAASEGTDVHADPLYPPLRRAAKLSWAAALVTGQVDTDKGDMRQALLEAPSIASRLRFVLAVLQKHAKVLAALAAVKEVQE